MKASKVNHIRHHSGRRPHRMQREQRPAGRVEGSAAFQFDSTSTIQQRQENSLRRFAADVSDEREVCRVDLCTHDGLADRVPAVTDLCGVPRKIG